MPSKLATPAIFILHFTKNAFTHPSPYTYGHPPIYIELSFPISVNPSLPCLPSYAYLLSTTYLCILISIVLWRVRMFCPNSYVNYASPSSKANHYFWALNWNFLCANVFPCEDSKTLSVCPYPGKRSHHIFVNISPTLVIDTSMERSLRVLKHGSPKISFFFQKSSKINFDLCWRAEITLASSISVLH